MKQGAQPQRKCVDPVFKSHRSDLRKPQHAGNGCRDTFPIGRFFLEVSASESRERVELRPPIVLGRLPFGMNPALLLKLVQSRVKGSVAHLKYVAGHLLQSLAESPSMQRLKSENLENQQIQGALNLLVLKILALEPLHGWALSQRL